MLANTSLPLTIGRKVHKFVFLFDRIVDQRLRKTLDVSLSQFRMLWAVHNHQLKASQSQIAAFHDVSRAAVSRQVDILVKRGLIERGGHPLSKRKYMVGLTPRGRTLFRKALAITEAELKKHLRPLGRRNLEQLDRYLGMILETINPYVTEHE
jgi:DNA-binding MarR family transcriptional regulator